MLSVIVMSNAYSYLLLSVFAMLLSFFIHYACLCPLLIRSSLSFTSSLCPLLYFVYYRSSLSVDAYLCLIRCLSIPILYLYLSLFFFLPLSILTVTTFIILCHFLSLYVTVYLCMSLSIFVLLCFPLSTTIY